MPKQSIRNRDGVSLRKGKYIISFVDIQGRRRQRTLRGAHTLTQARELRAAELQKVERAKVLGYTPPSEERFEQMLPRYLAHQKARLTVSAFQRTAGIVRAHLIPAFGVMKLCDIRRADIQKYVTARTAAVAPATVVRELNTLKHIFNLAVEWELITANPCAGLGKKQLPRIPAGRLRYLQPNELMAVTAACPGWLRPIVAIAALTGMRRSEILGLRWLDVDLVGKRVLLPQTKNGDGRVVYLNSLAIDVVASIPHSGGLYVFPASKLVNPANVSVMFSRVIRRLSIPDFRFHDLRHTAASWLRMQGADIHTVAQLLGHRDLRMACRYQHLSPTYLQAAVNGLDGVFGGLNTALTEGIVKGGNPVGHSNRVEPGSTIIESSVGFNP